MLTERRLEELIVEVEDYFGCGVIFGFYRKFVKEVVRRAEREIVVGGEKKVEEVSRGAAVG